jgi:hypothetical protein
MCIEVLAAEPERQGSDGTLRAALGKLTSCREVMLRCNRKSDDDARHPILWPVLASVGSTEGSRDFPDGRTLALPINSSHLH